MKTKFLLFILSVFLLNGFKSGAQVSARWYSYAGEYLSNDTSVDYQDIYLWNDTTGLFGYSWPPVTYSTNNFTSVGSSFAPVLPAWNNVPLYGSTIKVGPNDAYTIDSVRIYGAYLRNNAKPLPKDTLRLGFVYGNGAGTTNMPDYFLVGPFFLASYGYDTVNFPEMPHDSLHNEAGSYTGVATVPYTQSIVLGVADTSGGFERAFALTTPFAVPAGNNAAMSLTFKSGDASYVPFDTVGYASGSVKYGEFGPTIDYVQNSGSPVFAPYSPTDSNVGYFKQEGAADGIYAGLYSPTWTWSTITGAASILQYPVIDFHINCPTCDLSDTITGAMHLCAGASTPLAHSLTGGAWSSSSTSIATVSGTGVVYGVTGGVVTITYNLSGHHAYASFTVDALPAAISGSAHVCTGATTTLSDTSPGGTWSSGSTGVATMSGSIVGGRAPGSAVITYTLPTGCTITTIETVNPSPLPISGIAELCVALTTTLSDGTSGGTWATGSPAIATVGGGTGIVTGGASAGTDNITYTIVSGCYATVLVTVQTAPVAGTITGSSTVCPGETISLSDGAAGGSWSSGATGTATVNSSGTVTGIAAGSLTISYSVTNTCGTANAPYSVTVEPDPNAGTITATSDSVCEGSVLTLTDPATGGTWSSTNTLAATVDATGHVTGVAAGADNIVYTVANSCGTVTANLPVTVLSTLECSELGTSSVNGLAAAELKIFPNPNHGTFSVNLLSNSNEKVSIVISNILGEKVQEINTTTNKLTSVILNVPQGMYVLSATTSTGNSVAKLMIE